MSWYLQQCRVIMWKRQYFAWNKTTKKNRKKKRNQHHQLKQCLHKIVEETRRNIRSKHWNSVIDDHDLPDRLISVRTAHDRDTIDRQLSCALLCLQDIGHRYRTVPCSDRSSEILRVRCKNNIVLNFSCARLLGLMSCVIPPQPVVVIRPLQCRPIR